MNSTYLSEQNVWRIQIDNDLDLYNIPELEKLMNDCIAQKKIDFLLDCTNMSFIDSTGLGVLASFMKNVKEYDGKIKIIGLKAHIKKIFVITGLHTIFDIEGIDDEG